MGVAAPCWDIPHPGQKFIPSLSCLPQLGHAPANVFDPAFHVLWALLSLPVLSPSDERQVGGTPDRPLVVLSMGAEKADLAYASRMSDIRDRMKICNVNMRK